MLLAQVLEPFLVVAGAMGSGLNRLHGNIATLEFLSNRAYFISLGSPNA